jgi:hypothetical protein
MPRAIWKIRTQNADALFRRRVADHAGAGLTRRPSTLRRVATLRLLGHGIARRRLARARILHGLATRAGEVEMFVRSSR